MPNLGTGLVGKWLTTMDGKSAMEVAGKGRGGEELPC